jgi:PAS domain S-box-containing protein
MRDQDKSKQQLLDELGQLRRPAGSLEAKAHGAPEGHDPASVLAAGDGPRPHQLQPILRAAVECLPFEFFAIGPDGRYILQNAVSRQHYGDALGKCPEEVCADKTYLALWLENNRRAFAGERVEGEFETRIGGTTYCFYNIITPIWADGEICGILGVNVDITERRLIEVALKQTHNQLEQHVSQRTAELRRANEQLQREVEERKQADEALRQSHDQLQRIYDGMIEGLLITDIETKRIVRVNPSVCRMLGYSEEELVAKSVPDLHPPEEAANDLQRYQAAVEGRVSINEDRPVLRKDGRIFYADITGQRILYQGRPCLLALFRNVTERRQAQAAQERERRTLERMLRASDHERQLIAYDIHDGLAQQLAAAIMQFEVFDYLKETQPKQAADAYHAAMTMLRQGHSEARRLIGGVRPPILDESGVMAAISHLVHDPAFKAGPKIVFRSQVSFNRLAPVVENVIYRIVQEGLSNARNHSQSKKIIVSLIQRDNRLRIEILDWGVGFDVKEMQENRFGLEGIRQRARLLGGRCHIKSKPGRGTALVVELPVAEHPCED